MWFRSLFDALLACPSGMPVRRRHPAPSIRRRPCAVRPLLEILEDRTVLSTYTVNALTDTGAGSGQTGDLRYCVTHATSGNDTITFAPGLSGTIQLQSALPTLNASVDIQGPGAQVITVDGGSSNAYGFTVDGGAQVQIAGLTLYSSDPDVKKGSATISNCTVSDAYLFTDQKTINTGTALTVSNCTLDGATIDNWENGAALTVNNCTISGGGINNSGSATISHSSLSGSSIVNGMSETISYSTISGYTGNGSYGGPPDAVGAIQNTGNLTINNSTLSGNKAVGGPAYWVPTYSGAFTYSGGNGMGGGIYMDAGTLSINSSTIADNEAIGGSTAGVEFAGNSLGGGLYIAGGTVSINNSTFAGNQAVGGAGPVIGPGKGYGGGIYNAAGPGALQMHDTIVANNTADVGPDLYGSVTSLGYNLFGNSAGGSGFAASDLLSVNPQLGPLQNNGGPTQTMALLSGSPAIDAGDNSNAPANDQRGPGFPRIVNGTIDIGAFEVQNGSPTPTPTPASSLAVSGFPSPSKAGSPGSFTVTALNADGSTDTNYTGTVHFTSSDGQAGLPANYTFTAADAGKHTFNATLKTAGTQSITATDTTTAGITGTDSGITVQPAAASKLAVTGFPSPSTAGASHPFTVTAEDPYGNVATGYTGTVHFTSSDARAGLPANYTFTSADAGTHSFNATLKTAGTQSITATDTTTAGISGTDGGITVQPAAASKFVLTGPSSVTHGVPFSLKLTAEDPYGNIATGYTGTVHLSSTDSTASLPSNYTFTAGNAGVHTFTGLVLHKRGTQKVTATDTHNSSLIATDTISVG
jgi:hypothetical protein